MTDYTIVVDTNDTKFLDTMEWSGNDGLSSGDPLVVSVGDRVRVQNVFTDDYTAGGWTGLVDITSWQSGYWDTTITSSVGGNQTSNYRTVQAAAAGNTDTLIATAVGSDPALTDNFYISISAAADNTPENYTNLAGDKTGAALSTNYYATFSTTTPGTTANGTGFDVGTTVDNGTAISVASGQYKIDSGSFTSTAGTVNQNQTVYYRRTSSGSYSTAVTGSLTIGSVTRTFDITTGAQPATDPPTDLTFSPATTAAAATNVTVTASGGGSGTLEVSEDNSTWVANGSAFSKTRGTAYTFYARVNGTPVSSSYSEGYTVPYLLPDTAVTATNDTIAWDDTSATTTVGSGTTGDTYAVRVENGSTNLGTRTGDGDISFTASLPANGATTTYEIFSKRTVAVGGDNGYDATNDTFTVARQPVANAFSFTDVGSTNSGQSYTSNTITVAGLDTGQSVNVDFSSTASTVSYYKNGTSQGTSSTTAVNGDEFYISHIALSGNGQATDSTLTITNVSDTYTTTNSGTQSWLLSSLPAPPTNEGVQIGVTLNLNNSTTDTDFWWSVSPTDVNTSSGSGTTSYSPATKGVPATNIGGFNFTPNEDYTTDSSDPYNYTITVRSGSASGTVEATHTHAVNDSSIPLLPDAAISAVADQALNYVAGSDNGHAITIGGAADNNSYYDVVPDGATTPVFGTEIGNGTLEVADDNISPGGSATFDILARRPVANLGDNSYYDTSRGYTIFRRPGPPTISVTDDDAAAASVTTTINITAAGDGANSYEYQQNSDGWVTGNTFTQARNVTTTDYFARSKGANGYVSNSIDSVVNYNPGYIAPDTAVTATNDTIAWDDTSATTTVGSGTAGETYAVRVENGSTNLGTRTGDGDISFTTSLPAVGDTTTYEIFASRPTNIGGDAGYDATNDTFTVERSVEPVTDPIDLTFSTAATASATVNVTVTAVGGSGGILQVSDDNSTWVASESTFSKTRGTQYTFYARRLGANSASVSGVYSEAYTVPYLLPDTAVTATNDTIAFDATSATTTVGSGTAGDTYAVRVENGSTNLGTRTGDGDISFTASLPAIGATTTYEIFSKRTVAVGGDNGYDATNDTFTVERSVETVTDPTDLTFSTAATAAAATNVTVTASGGSGGTLEVSDDNSTWVANGSAFSKTRGTQYTFYARRLGADSASVSGVYSEAYTVPYLLPDTAVTATDDTIAFDDTSATTTVGSGTAGDTYAVRVENGSTNLGTRTGDGDISFTASLPAIGATTTYEIFSKRTVAVGGDNGYDATNDTFTVERSAEGLTDPTDLTFSTAATASATVNVTVTASGGSGGTLEVSEDNSTWVANGSAFSKTRGTQYTFYARRLGANSASVSGVYDENYTVPYLLPDTAVTATNDTIAWDDTSATTTVGSGTTGDTYAVRVENGSTNLGTRTGDGDISFTASLPANGATTTYEIFSKRTVAVGGDNGYDATNDTFTVARQPVANAFSFTDVGSTNSGQSYTSNTITVAGLDTGQSVNVDFSSTASTVSYYKNGTSQGTSSTTAVNGDEFYISHIALSGNGQATDSTLTITNVSDTYTTTNSGTQSWLLSSLPAPPTNEGVQIGVTLNLNNSTTDTDFWWSVSPTDVNTSSGSGTTSYSPATKGVPATNIGGFNFTPNEDYTTDSSDPYNYTITVRSGSASGTVEATHTHAVNDSSIPLLPDAAISAVADQALNYVAGSDNGHAITIGGAADNNSYYDVVPDGATTPVFGTEIGNGTLEVADDNISPGGSATFDILARRPVANLGDNSYYDTSRGYTIFRRPGPPTISVTDDDAAAASVTTTINITAAGEGANSYEYQQNSDGWVTGNTFTQARNVTTTDYFARSKGANGYVSNSIDSVVNYNPGYIAPDTAVTATNDTIAWDDTSATTTVGSGTAGETYAVRVENGSTNLGTRTGDGDISFTTSLPAVGDTTTYEIFASRPTNIGGDAGYDATNDTFTVERSVEPVTDPIDLTFSTAATASATVNVTVTAVGGSGGILQVSDDNSTWVASESTFSKTRGTQYTFYARRLGANSASVSGVYSDEQYTVPYLLPDTAVTATNDTIAWDDTSATTTVGSGTAGDTYAVRVENGPTNLGTRTGDGDISFTASLPAIGATTTYEIFSKRTVAVGGDNGYDATNDTFTVERSVEPLTDPTDLTFSTAATASATAGVTVTASGGSGGTLEVSEDNSTWVANGSAFSKTRGTEYTFYARRLGANSASVSGVYSEAYTVPYLLPDTTVTATDDTIAFDDTSATTTVGSGSSNDTYAVRVENGSTNLGTRTGDGDISFTTSLPLAGDTTTYEIFSRRSEASGGDEVTFYDTNDAFTVTRSAEPLTDPIDLTFSTPDNGSATAVVTVTAVGGSGGILQVSDDNSTWVASESTFSKTRGTQYTFYARRLGANSASVSGVYSEAYTVPYDSGADTTPESYTNLAGNVTNAASNTYYYATFSTSTPGTTANGTGFSLSGEIDTSTTASAVTGGQVRTSADSTWASSKTVSSSDTVFFRGLSATTGSGSSIRNHILTIGTVTQSFTTTLSGGSSGNNDYGFQIYNPSEELILDSRTFKQSTVIVSGTTNVQGQSTSSFISCPDMTSTNQSEIEILYLEISRSCRFRKCTHYNDKRNRVRRR